ncbi:MAG TPA: complex I subunit 1 family protein [Candidatus Dormibacteraeota bacterium]|nr:complex I subunit 1 family protein [Candidatus Dormibacteraeota bacterium]
MNAALQATLEFWKLYWAPLLCGVAVVAILPLMVGYIVLVERKIMADMQARLGPMRVGPHGLLQPIADAVKLLIKEDIIPENADKLVFWLAPVLSVGAGLLSVAGLAIGPAFQIAEDVNIGILFVVGISALGIFGIVLGGWASNSHYSLMGALRSSAQLVSYETAAGMALVSALLFTGSLNIKSIVEAQSKEGIWFVLLAPVAFFTYLVASIAKTNRAPFDLPEAESELVAGYMTEFSGFRWSLYFLAEYTNMIVVASVATTLFLGGWLRPFSGVSWLNFLDFAPPLLLIAIGAYCVLRVTKQPTRVQQLFMLAVAGLCFVVALVLAAPVVLPVIKPSLREALAPFYAGIHGGFWFIFKVSLYIYFFMWLRFTMPRYRFDQLMRLGWHFLIPLSIINVLLVGVALIVGAYFHLQGWGLFLVTTPAAILALVAAFLILAVEKQHDARQDQTAASDFYAG